MVSAEQEIRVNPEVYDTAVALFHRRPKPQKRNAPPAEPEPYFILQLQGEDTQGQGFSVVTELDLDAAKKLKDQLSASLRGYL